MIFYSVTVVALLFGVLDSSWAQALSDVKITDENQTKQWLQELDVSSVAVISNFISAHWNLSVNITKANNLLLNQAMERLVNFSKVVCRNASRYDGKDFTDKSLTRQLEMLNTCVNTTKDDLQTMQTLKQNMSTIYNSGKVCKGENNCISLEPNLTSLMATSRDWEELKWAWEGWHNATGKQMKPQYAEFITVLNKDARLRGLRNYGDIWAKFSGIDNLASVCEELWQQVKPLYRHLHAYVRRKLMHTYQDNAGDFPSSRLIPAHILGDLWAQRWVNILDRVKPFPNSTAIDLTKLLNDKGFTVLRMVRESESFFTSLGLPAMPQEFWNHSLFEKPTDGRTVMCHPSATDFHNRRDFRIRMCAEVTGKFFGSIHHEMGHIEYFLSYKDHPVVFQHGANPAFHEAIGDLITLSVMTPGHLRKVNLLSDTTDDTGSDLNFLMRQALSEFALLPFLYLVDRWRSEVFNETITPDNYNQNFWKLRCSLQGVSPPVTRSEEDFDIASLYHISINAPYISYFLSFIMQFQFHKSLCTTAGHVGALHKCDIYNSTAAGNKLRSMLSLGSSKPWQDAMEAMTGQRSVDAGPLLEYFRPLKEWLETENKDKDVGWEENCPA